MADCINSANELRIIVVFRSDLPEMTRAKGEVQFGHAIADLFCRAASDVLHAYMTGGQVKISMEVANLAAIQAIQARAVKRGVNQALVTDAGRTIFSEPTITCIGLGPMSKTDGNAVTRGASMRL